ncbi:hypothetical protein DPMN_124731 [Dreissena polymorpha]|uniref:Uncharacterized protein n=1 Tax=Dreissena polymorpha TaxID=45954 RepID=A0A9D4JWG8_DREPO|nr:hypothetical protein DPMN_124731 [Dreissena polymorpha]
MPLSTHSKTSLVEMRIGRACSPLALVNPVSGGVKNQEVNVRGVHEAISAIRTIEIE